MGCDIHMYVEFRDKTIAAGSSPEPWQRTWRSFGGCINPGRCYRMFEALAGVRGDETNAVVPPRGMPEDAGYYSFDDYTLYISDSPGADDSEDVCSRQRADGWAKNGSSILLDTNKKPITPAQGELTTFDTDKAPSVAVGAVWVTHPDWHTHSWLTTDEYAKAIRSVSKPSEAPEYYAVLAVLRQFDAIGYDARVVFWFDN